MGNGSISLVGLFLLNERTISGMCVRFDVSKPISWAIELVAVLNTIDFKFVEFANTIQIIIIIAHSLHACRNAFTHIR